MKSIYLLLLGLVIAIPCFGQIQLLNDEFNDARSIVNWKDINVEEGWGIDQWDWVSINDSTQGKLQLVPITASWFGEYRGPLLFKEVSGDFVITTKVDVFGRDFDFPLNNNYNLAGVMVRAPQHYPNGALGLGGWDEDQQDYIFLAAGNAASNHPTCQGCQPPHFEVKSTNNSNSNLEISSIDTSSVEIRLARINSAILVLYRLANSPNWQVHRRYNRTDFPDTLQVGLVVYTDWAGVSSLTPQVHNSTENYINPDIIGEFEFARFDSVFVPQPLVGLDFSNELAVSDAEILTFLSYDSEPWCPDQILIDFPVDSNSFYSLQARDFIQVDSTVHSQSIVLLQSDSLLISPNAQINSNALLEVNQPGCIQN